MDDVVSKDSRVALAGFLSQRFGSLFADAAGIVLHFGDPASERAAIASAAAIAIAGIRATLELGGADRLSFLHAMVSNDVGSLVSGIGTYAAFLYPNGKMISDLRILVHPDVLWLICEAPFAGLVAAQLDKYIIQDDVALRDVTAEWELMAVHGPRSRALLAAAGLDPGELAEHQHREVESGGLRATVVAVRTLGVEGYEIWSPLAGLAELAGRLEAARAAADGRWAGFLATEAARIDAGVPRFGADMDHDTLPPEVDYLVRHAISTTKGCYMGQETIARIASRGHVNRNLVLLEARDAAGAAALVPGAPIRVGEKTLGKITSVSAIPGLPTRALAFVRSDGMAAVSSSWTVSKPAED